MAGQKNLVNAIRHNSKLREILVIEPELILIIVEAAMQRNTNGYDRIRTYTRLRNAASKLVGWTCDNPKLKNKESYDLIRALIEDLLPRDNDDKGQ